MTLERAAIVALLVVVAGQAAASCVARGHWRTERLAAANTLADRAAQENWLRGQLRVAVRYVHQGQVELHESQRERNQQAKLAASFELEAQELRGRVGTTSVFAGDTVTFYSTFGRLDSTGFLVEAQTRVWPMRPVPPPRSDVFYRVQLAPVPLQVGFACVGPNGRFYVTAPRNRPLQLERGVVAADVCNPPPPRWEPFSLRRPPSLPWMAALVGVGFVLRASLPH